MSIKIFIIALLCIYKVYCQTVGDSSYSQEIEDYAIKNVNLKGNAVSVENENNALSENTNVKEDSGSAESVNFLGKNNKDTKEDSESEEKKKHGYLFSKKKKDSEENTEEKTEENNNDDLHNNYSNDDITEQLEPKEDRFVQEFNDDEDEDIEEFKRHESDENEENLLKEELEKEREKEKLTGSVADYFGTNQHYEIPANFYEFGRRFVLSYPYFEKNDTVEPAEMKLDRDVKEQQEVKKHYFNHLTPMKAPPEFVLSVAKQSAILEATKPKNPSEDVITKDILRTGNFWNGVWKEDVDKKTLLRTSSKGSNKLEKVTVEIEPGSKLYELVSVLKKRSPVLLYVINKYNAD